MPLVKLTIRDDLVEIAEEHIEGLRAQGLLEEADDGEPGDQAGTETAGGKPGTKEQDA
jgi:hypothetical protein